jgi:hypothetical protein
VYFLLFFLLAVFVIRDKRGIVTADRVIVGHFGTISFKN